MHDFILTAALIPSHTLTPLTHPDTNTQTKGLHRVHQVRQCVHRPRSVHSIGRLPLGKALGPAGRAAGVRLACVWGVRARGEEVGLAVGGNACRGKAAHPLGCVPAGALPCAITHPPNHPTTTHHTHTQGRLPVRVELKGLTQADFYRILTEPTNNMIRQQQVRLWRGGAACPPTDVSWHVFVCLGRRCGCSLVEPTNKMIRQERVRLWSACACVWGDSFLSM